MAADMREPLADGSDREEGEMTPETLSPRGEFMELDARGDINNHNGAASNHSVEPLATVHEADNGLDAEVRKPSPPPVAIVHRSQLLNAMNAPLPPLAAGQHSPAETGAPNTLSMPQPAQVPAQLPSLAPLPPQQTSTQQQIAQAAKKARQRAHKRAKLAQAGAADPSTPASGTATPPSDDQNHAHIAAQEATQRAVAAFLSQQEHILSVAPSGPVVRHESLVISFDDDDFHSSDQLPAQAGLVPKQGQRVLTDLEVKMAQLRAQIAKQERPQGIEKALPASLAPPPPLMAAAPLAKPSAFFAPRPPSVHVPAKPQVIETGTATNRYPLTSTSKAALQGKALNPTLQPKAPAMRTANGVTSTAHASTASQALIAQGTAHSAPLQQQRVVPVLGFEDNGSAEQTRTAPESAQLGAELPSARQAVTIKAARSQPTDKSTLPRPSSRSPPADPPAATTNPPGRQSGLSSGISAVQRSSKQNVAQMAPRSDPSGEHQPAVPGVVLSSLAAQPLVSAVQPAAQAASPNNPSAEHQSAVPDVPSSSPGGQASLSPPAPTPSAVPVQIPEATQVPPNPQVVAQPDTNTTSKQAATPSKPPSAGKRRSVKRSAASSSPAGIAKLAADMGPMKRLRQLSGLDNPRNTPTPDGQSQQSDAARNGSPDRAVPEQAVAVQSEPQSPDRAASQQAVAVQSEPQSPNAIQAALVDAEEMERNVQGSLYNQQAAVRRLEVRRARLLAELSVMDAALNVEKQKAAEYQQKLHEASAAVLARHSQLLHSVQQAVPVLQALEAPPSDVQASSCRQKPPVVVEGQDRVLALPQSNAQDRVPVPNTVPHLVAALQAGGGAAATFGAACTASIDAADIGRQVSSQNPTVAQHAAVQQADASAAKKLSRQPASHAARGAMNVQGAVSQLTSSSASPNVKERSAPYQTARPRHKRHHITSPQRATAEASPTKISSPHQEGNITSSSQGTMPPKHAMAGAAPETVVTPVQEGNSTSSSQGNMPSKQVMAEAAPETTVTPVQEGNPTSLSQGNMPVKQVTAEAAPKTTVTPAQEGNPTSSSHRSMPPKQAQLPPTAPIARKAVSEASAVPVASQRAQSSLRVSVSASPCTITSSAQPAASSPQKQLQAERSEAEKSLRALEMTLQQQRLLALSAEKARLLASSQKRKEEPLQSPIHTGPGVQLAPSPRTSDTGMCVGMEAETKLQSTSATASAPSADAAAEPAHASVQVKHTGPEVQPTPSPRTSGTGMHMGSEADTQFHSTPATAEPPHASVQFNDIKQEQLSSPHADAGCVEGGTVQAAAESAMAPSQSRNQQQEAHAVSEVAAAEDAAATGPEEAVLAASKSPERRRSRGASEPVPARVAFPDNGLRNQPSFSTWLKPQGAQTILPSSRPALVFANWSAFPSIRFSTPDLTQSVHAANNPQAQLPYSSPLAWFRSSRLLRQYQHAWHKSLQSATFTHNIKANKPLCPYDLRGKCNDKDCAKQHQEQYNCTDKQALQDLNNLLDAAREHVKGKQVSKARSIQELERLLDSEKSLNMVVFGRRVGFRVKMLDAEVGMDGLLGEEVPKYYLLNHHETAFSTLSDYWFDFGDTAAASSWVLPSVGSSPNPHVRADNSARLAANRDQRYYNTGSPAPSPTDMQHAERTGTDEDEVAALETHIQDNPTDCEAWVALAVKCYLHYNPVHASKQAQEEALKALAKALDIAPQNVAIWWVYLHLFCKRQDATEAAEMLGYGVQYCRFSYELWCFVISNAESVSMLQDISYRAMVWLSASVLLSTGNGHRPSDTDSSSSRALAAGLDSWQHKSACLLDIALRLLAALSMAGQSELALVWVNELVSLAETPPDSRPAAYNPSPQQVQDPNLAAVPAEPHALIGLLTALHPRDVCVLWLAAAHTVVQGALPQQVAKRLGYQQDLLVIDWPAVDKSENWDATQGALVERLFTAASRGWQGCMGVYSEAGGSVSTQNDIVEARECFAANAVLWTHAMSGAQVAVKTSSVLVARYPTSCQLLRLHLTLLSATSGLTEVAAVVHKALLAAVKGQQTAGFHKSISDFLALCLQDQSSAAAAVDALLLMLKPQKASRMQGFTPSQEHVTASPRDSLARLLQVYNFVSSRVRVFGDDEAYRHINLACLHMLDSNAEAALAAMHEAIKAANSSSARQRVAKEYLALLQLSSSPMSVVSTLCDLIAPDVRMLQPLAQPLQGFDDKHLLDVCTPPALMDCNGWTKVLLQLLKETPIFVQNTSIWVEAIEAALLLMPSEVSIALSACKKVFAPAAKGMRQEHLPACVWALRLTYESLLHAKQTAGDAAWEEVAQYCLAIEATDVSLATCKQGLKLYPFSVKLRQQLDIGVQTAAGEAQAGASAGR